MYQQAGPPGGEPGGRARAGSGRQRRAGGGRQRRGGDVIDAEVVDDEK